MTDTNGDKRKARNKFELIVPLHEACNGVKKEAKDSVNALSNLFKKVHGGKAILNQDEFEAVTLDLGRNHKWKTKQLEIVRAVQKGLVISRTSSSKVQFDIPWKEFINRCIQANFFDVVHFLFKVKLNSDILENDYISHGSQLSDPWDSVHFYCLDILANVVISIYWENTSAGRFLRSLGERGVFESILDMVNHEDSSRFLTTCLAIYVASNVSHQHVSVCKRICKSHNLLPKLAFFIHRENAFKLATEWFQNGVEQFEFDALAERPDGLAVMKREGVFEQGVTEMSRKKAQSAAMQWATSLQYHSIEFLSAMCHPDVGHREAISKDHLLMKALTKWFRTPIINSDICLLVQAALRVVSLFVNSESISWKLLDDYHYLKHLELAVYYPNAVAVSVYMEIMTRIMRHKLLRKRLVNSEILARAAVVNLYSFDENSQVYSLAFLHIVVENNSKLLLRLFPPRDIRAYADHYFDKSPSGLSVSELIISLRRHCKREFEETEKNYPTIIFDNKKATEIKEEGNKLFKESHFREAMRKYTEALEFCSPTKKESISDKGCRWNELPVSLYCNRAQCYLRLRQYRNAVEDCDVAIGRCLGVAGRDKAFDEELLKKAIYRRSKALFELKEYHRAALDIGECLMLEPDRREFRAHMDKVMLSYRQRNGFEAVRKCVECDGNKGMPLRKCSKCTALYCSRVCQLSAWKNYHKFNCHRISNDRDHRLNDEDGI